MTNAELLQDTKNNDTSLHLSSADFNAAKFARFFSSDRNTIVTPEIARLLSKITNWIEYGNTGAVIYGRQRIGKSRAVRYIAQDLHRTYGNNLPTLLLNENMHKPTARYFYQEMLQIVGDPFSSKGTVSDMRKRLIDRLLTESKGTDYGMVVLFIDEAQHLYDNDYLWLIDIYNCLDVEDVQFSVILIGQPELKEQRLSYGKNPKTQQIYGRFMTTTLEYKGIQNLNELTVIMNSLEKELNCYVDDERINMTKQFFPRAFHENDSIVNTSKDFWSAFKSIQNKYNINDNEDLPMEYFMKAYLHCLLTYGQYSTNGDSIYLPKKKEWKECIMASGYVDSAHVIA